ncbi:MAG: hypothetical protein R2825_12295 [Saprospiraceae bacterium]
MTNTGEVNIEEGLINSGTLTNTGVLNLNSGGELILKTNPASLPGGTFNWNSWSRLTIGDLSEMTLSGALTIESGRTLRVNGTLKLNAALTNNGVLELNSGEN